VLGGKARALMAGRYHVSFDDIRALAGPVLRHRMALNFAARAEGATTASVIERLCQSLF
jgi:MoxR-like ATPase